MKPQVLEQLGLGFSRRIPREAIANFMKSSGIGIAPNSPLNSFLGGKMDANFKIGKGVGKALRALSNPFGSIRQQIILANQIVETTVYVCRTEDGSRKLIGFWDESGQVLLSGFWDSSNMILGAQTTLNPKMAGPASNFSWELSKSGCVALFSLVDCIRHVYFHSLIARHAIEGLRISIQDLTETLNQNTNQPDNRWMLSLIGQVIPELAVASHLHLHVGMQELVDSGLAVRSDSDPQVFYPTDGTLELVKQLLLPLPAVGLSTIEFGETPRYHSRLLVRGHAFWDLSVVRDGTDDPKIVLSNLDSTRCLDSIANQLETVIVNRGNCV